MFNRKKIVEQLKGLLSKKPDPITKIEGPKNTIYVNGAEDDATFTFSMPYEQGRPVFEDYTSKYTPAWDDTESGTFTDPISVWNKFKFVNTPLLNMHQLNKPAEKWPIVKKGMSMEHEMMWGPVYKIEVGKIVFNSHRGYLKTVNRMLDKWTQK